MAHETVNYRAVSVFSSKTIWFNVLSAIVAILALPELTEVLGPDAMRYVALIIAAANVAIRFLTVRPVALVPPGKTKPVAVRKLA